jgi:mRNA interferase MazF
MIAFGTVVLLPFPFSNQVQTKRRPAVVVSNERYNMARPDIVVMAITSQIQTSASVGDASIEDWHGAGLIKPSAIKPLFATIEKAIVIKSLGTLAPADQDLLDAIIRYCLGRQST